MARPALYWAWLGSSLGLWAVAGLMCREIRLRSRMVCSIAPRGGVPMIIVSVLFALGLPLVLL